MSFAGVLDFTFRFALSQRTIILHSNVEGFSRYLDCYLISPQFQRDIASNATWSAAMGVKAREVEESPNQSLRWPSKSESWRR